MSVRSGQGALSLLRTADAALLLLVTATLVLLSSLLRLPFLWLLIPFTAAAAVAWWWYLPRFTASVAARFGAAYIRVKVGVFWRRETHIPVPALRTFEIWEPPFHRLFGCCTLLLRFAGGSAVLPLLAGEDARHISRFLRENTGYRI